jgi:hypothetical protein
VRRWPTVVAIVGAIVAGCIVLLVPGWAGRVIQLYVALLGVLTAMVLVDRARSSFSPLPRDAGSSSRFQRAAHVGTPGFERTLRQVELGLGRGDDFEQFLRPELAAISSRLLLRQGVVMEAQPARAAELLGQPLWGVVRPDRLASVPEKGLRPEELSGLFDRLEALA